MNQKIDELFPKIFTFPKYNIEILNVNIDDKIIDLKFYYERQNLELDDESCENLLNNTHPELFTTMTKNQKDFVYNGYRQSTINQLANKFCQYLTSEGFISISEGWTMNIISKF